MNQYAERTAVLRCGDDALHAVVAVPHAPASTGVVIVVGGPQYRAGSHRQFVSLARALAAAGFAVLRFDHRGMGDSGGEARGFEGLADDMAAAIDGLAAEVDAVERVVLWGLCDGASAALLYCHERVDPRVAGMCLANPWVRSDDTLARTHVKHYYGQRLLQRDFWRKLLRGQVARRALTDFTRNLRLSVEGPARAHRAQPPFRDRMAAGWRRFPGNTLLLLSDGDLTAREFVEHTRADKAWRGLIDRQQVERHDLVEADHTFSTASARLAVERLVVDWMERGEVARHA